MPPGQYTYTAQPFQGTAPYTTDVSVDSVRFLIGDTREGDWQLADGEIIGLLNNNANDIYQAAIEACRSLMGHYAREVDKSIGDASISASKRLENYKMLRAELTVQSARHGGAATMWSGGQSEAEAENDELDLDLTQPQFRVGMTDNPDTGSDLATGPGFSQVVPG